MKYSSLNLFCVGLIASGLACADSPPVELFFDYDGFDQAVHDTRTIRATRRIGVERFIEMASDPDTVILDTRSADNYALLHVAGAVHLNFSDITNESLAAILPSKDTRILIYCNNNFINAPKPFPRKIAVAALNLPTFVTLVSYGYRNVYELKSVLDPNTTALDFDGRLLATKGAASAVN